MKEHKNISLLEALLVFGALTLVYGAVYIRHAL